MSTKDDALEWHKKTYAEHVAWEDRYLPIFKWGLYITIGGFFTFVAVLTYLGKLPHSGM